MAETGEREFPGLLGHLGKARPHLWVGMSQPSSKTQVPAPHSARPLRRALEGVRGPKNSTWRKEETPGAGLGGPLSGRLLPLPVSPFSIVPLCAGGLRRRRASQAWERALSEGPGTSPSCP